MNSKSPRIILFILVLLATGTACDFATEFFMAEPELYHPEEPAPIEPPVEVEPRPALPSEQLPATEALSCPTVKQDILEAATGFYEDGASNESGTEPDQLYLTTYNVKENRISDPVYYDDVSADLKVYQEDQVGHQEIWDYFVTLIPTGERESLVEYSIVTDGEGNLLASVAQTPYDPALWGLEVDIRDSDDKLNLTYTLIHEYAHLLTLGPDQVTPSEAVFNNPDDDNIFYNEVTACPNYFPGEGCSHVNSYINAFYDRFWADIFEEWLDTNLIEDDDTYYEALDEFYFTYEDRFLTDYAATNPEEDIAEAFTFFVLSPRPAGDTTADEKILFFYDYLELVELRDEITTGICSLNP